MDERGVAELSTKSRLRRICNRRRCVACHRETNVFQACGPRLHGDITSLLNLQIPRAEFKLCRECGLKLRLSHDLFNKLSLLKTVRSVSRRAIRFLDPDTLRTKWYCYTCEVVCDSIARHRHIRTVVPNYKPLTQSLDTARDEEPTGSNVADRETANIEIDNSNQPELQSIEVTDNVTPITLETTAPIMIEQDHVRSGISDDVYVISDDDDLTRVLQQTRDPTTISTSSINPAKSRDLLVPATDSIPAIPMISGINLNVTRVQNITPENELSSVRAVSGIPEPGPSLNSLGSIPELQGHNLNSNRTDPQTTQVGSDITFRNVTYRKRLPCNKCDKTFTSKDRLLHHKAMEFKRCQFCNAYCCTPTQLKKHLRTMHPLYRRNRLYGAQIKFRGLTTSVFPCLTCGKTFQTERIYRDHVCNDLRIAPNVRRSGGHEAGVNISDRTTPDISEFLQVKIEPREDVNSVRNLENSVSAGAEATTTQLQQQTRASTDQPVIGNASAATMTSQEEIQRIFLEAVRMMASAMTQTTSSPATTESTVGQRK